MLIKFLVLAVVIAGAILWLSPEARAALRPHLPRLLVIGALVVLALLAATGRLSWIGAALAGLLALAQRLLPMVLRFGWIAGLLGRRGNAGAGNHGSAHDSSQGAAQSDAMTRARALEILGLEGEPDREAILAAHRRLIQRCHPDRGGSPYLAARLNEARDCLLGGARA